MIRKGWDYTERFLRRVCGAMSPRSRIIVVFTMLALFTVVSLYFTISSIYQFGKGTSKELYIRQIEPLTSKRPQELVEADSIYQ